MKSFAIINGKEIFIWNCVSIEKASETAVNICDHSKEIIIREVDITTKDSNNNFNLLDAI